MNLKKEIAKKYGYSEVGDFYEGRAWAVDETGHFHINKAGKPAYKERYKGVGWFREGLATAKDQNGWFHINHHGRAVYQERYDFAGDFQDGLALVGLDLVMKEYFYINKNFSQKVDFYGLQRKYLQEYTPVGECFFINKFFFLNPFATFADLVAKKREHIQKYIASLRREKPFEREKSIWFTHLLADPTSAKYLLDGHDDYCWSLVVLRIGKNEVPIRASILKKVLNVDNLSSYFPVLEWRDNSNHSFVVNKKR